MRYQWDQIDNGLWLFNDPAGIMAAQIEYNESGRKEWVAYDLTTEGAIPLIGRYSELGQAKNAVEEYFRPPERRQAGAL